jgi:hypothetical protein
MNWYMAKIVYRIICGDGDHTPQFDEQLRLIEAEDSLHAFNKAQSLGHREQDNFLNQAQALVQWKFINVCELYQLDRLTDGVELYSRIQEEKDADTFVHITNLKAAHLMDRHAQHFLNKL